MRGLPRHKTAPAALSVYNNPAKTQVGGSYFCFCKFVCIVLHCVVMLTFIFIFNPLFLPFLQVFMRMGVLTEVERESRRNVTNTSFLRHITIELRTMLMLLETEIIPAGFRLQEELSRSINQAADAMGRVEERKGEGEEGEGEGGKGMLEPQVERLKRVGSIVSQLIEMADSHRSLLQVIFVFIEIDIMRIFRRILLFYANFFLFFLSHFQTNNNRKEKQSQKTNMSTPIQFLQNFTPDIPQL